ncbi:MAG TPA: hypothetical protein VGC87_24260 [Pyrinomonadaceae bacterium]|jgi:hypothetical protein
MGQGAKEEKKDESLSVEEMRERVITLAFGGEASRFEEFCEVVRAAMPEGTAAVLRGSAITGERWKDGTPFDSRGPGSSDLDLTLVGSEVLSLYILDGFYLPGVHTKPLSDKDPDIAPDLIPLRHRLQKMVKRPVNIQATRDFVMHAREHWFGQPYLTLFGSVGES